MFNNAQNQTQSIKRQQSLEKLSQIYSKIQFLELSQKQFSTDELHQLSLLSQYSIHPIYSSKQLHQFHLKLTQKYWERYQQLKNLNKTDLVQNRESIIQHNVNLQDNDINSTQNKEQINVIQQTESNIEESNNSLEDKITEAIIPQVKQVKVQLKVNKSYNQIKKFFIQFDYQKVIQQQTISTKIKLLNAWTSIPCKMQNLIQKKIPQNICKIDSTTYLQNIKMGKNDSRKNSTNQQPPRTIILGKNQSTTTKQIKHTLKVQAKKNFVEQKQKEEQKLDEIQKKSIELTYLLNIITKQYFQDFYNDILNIIRQNGEIIEVFCQKIIEKVKEQHNFIQIYVQLIKKLTKKPLKDQDSQKRFNELQQYFVIYLQEQFTKLISSQTQRSQGNSNQYKYQKQMMGMCKFIGKLIKQRILSKKIFKVCFWQIVYRYVQKVKQNPQNDIVNECLIEGIVTISNEMGKIELCKLIQKQKQRKSIQQEEVNEIDKLQQMMLALVDPSDEDDISRQQSYKKLIQEIKIEQYPHILKGLMELFGSKRMKLQFLIQGWYQKIQALKSNQSIQTKQQTQNSAIQQQQIIQQPNNNLVQIKHTIHQFIEEVKNITINKDNKRVNNGQLMRHQNIIKKLFTSSQNTQQNNTIFKLLIVQFLNQFADSKHFDNVIQRITYFIHSINKIKLNFNIYQKFTNLICQQQIENLMIIQCDYPFLVDGLCLILTILSKHTHIMQSDIEATIRQNFDPQDQDMTQFYQKIQLHFNKITNNSKVVKIIQQMRED